MIVFYFLASKASNPDQDQDNAALEELTLRAEALADHIDTLREKNEVR